MKQIKIYNDTSFLYLEIGNCIDFLMMCDFDKTPVGTERYWEYESKVKTFRVCFVNMKSFIKCYVVEYQKKESEEN